MKPRVYTTIVILFTLWTISIAKLAFCSYAINDTFLPHHLSLASELISREKTTLIYGSVVSFARDIKIAHNQWAKDVVCILGDATIEGKVSGICVVIGGSLELKGYAQEVVVVFGKAYIFPGAKVEKLTVLGDLMVDEDAEISTITHNVHIAYFSSWLHEFLSKVLLQGRIWNPSLSWCYWVLLVLFIICGTLLWFFHSTAVQIADQILLKPFVTFISGILVLILIPIVSSILIITGIGILLLPLFGGGLLICFLIGFVGLCIAIGKKIVGNGSGSVLCFIIGALLCTIVFALPIVGLLIGALTKTIAIGAVALVLISKGHSYSPPKECKSSPSVSHNISNSQYTYKPAGFWIRLLASLIDMIIVVIIAKISWPPITLVLLILYHIIMWGWINTTIGGAIFKLRIIRVDGKSVDFATSTVRALAAILSCIPAFLGFFWVAWSPTRQSWHDMIAKTVIVREVPEKHDICSSP